MDISILKDIQNQNIHYIKYFSSKYNNFIYSLSWWIPIKKWRYNFRSKFRIETRPDQTRPDHELICKDYIYIHNNSKHKKIQPMFIFYTAA
ncbi:hypothetical protein [uncultured Brachyspira sp.]|uniref:hypothetical protein n=1 Tax=uncultured Brachyspira sp. TaxID=221953 RepID=UPI002628A96E|nr:hypothetical protein [uncultured Brachyspira sp.]